jgi:hypothetical protein
MASKGEIIRARFAAMKEDKMTIPREIDKIVMTSLIKITIGKFGVK